MFLKFFLISYQIVLGKWARFLIPVFQLRKIFSPQTFDISFVRALTVFADLYNFLTVCRSSALIVPYRIVFARFDCKLLQNRKTVDCSTVLQ